MIGRVGRSAEAHTAPGAAGGGAEGGRGEYQLRTLKPVVACVVRAPVWIGPRKIRLPLGLPGALSRRRPGAVLALTTRSSLSWMEGERRGLRARSLKPVDQARRLAWLLSCS